MTGETETVAELQAKLEQAERERARMDLAHDLAANRALAAESALAAAQGALREGAATLRREAEQIMMETCPRHGAGEEQGDCECPRAQLQALADALARAALADESGKAEPRSVFPPHNHEPSAPIMARCPGCEAVKALLESGKPGGEAHAPEVDRLRSLLMAARKQGGAPRDHACDECVPHSDMLVPGFKCWFHVPLDRAAPPALPAELSGDDTCPEEGCTLPTGHTEPCDTRLPWEIEESEQPEPGEAKKEKGAA